MTHVYQAFPFARAIRGIAAAGYRYVAWGPWHERAQGAKPKLTLEADAPPAAARELGRISRDAGLEPLLMFANHYPEKPDGGTVYRRRIEQAHAAGVRYVLGFSSPESVESDLAPWMRAMEGIGPLARAAGVTLVIKQHGGITAPGASCARLVRRLADPGVRMFYDAGNVWWYGKTDPIPDLALSARLRIFTSSRLHLTGQRAMRRRSAFVSFSVNAGIIQSARIRLHTIRKSLKHTR